ncbi:AP endonuclease [Pseudomonas fulva]|uniref:sugar phosphate isomerase/epimerase family protein n=1 Tax=Pseudomonas fulva TaxID=47880 RepID=UPI001428D650|nr:AP endonuclease [Pseudomonas fulva]NIX93512.1 AP endonuclease [Pseudomonas fulva]
MHANPVSISLSSYGADFVRQRGQEQFIDLLASAGASRVELREELFSCQPDPTALGAFIAGAGLQCLYSTPLDLWCAQGILAPELKAKLRIAKALGAVAVKVSLGHYRGDVDMRALRALLTEDGPVLLVENDQTEHGGRIAPLVGFFEQAQACGVRVGMTFDIGNWQWLDEPVLEAANRLGRWVEYVHCKAVRRHATGRLAAAAPQAPDLEHWQQVLAHFTPGVARAVEYPLLGEDLLTVTRSHVRQLSALGARHDARELSHA